MRCKVCLKIVRHPARKTKVLQVCGYCQKNASEHSEKLWDMHKRAIEKSRFCPFHKKIEKLYPITIGKARASIARVCRLNAAPPYDVDFVPIHMQCSNPNCKLYLSYVEEDRADVLDGLCLKCFRELPELDIARKSFREVHEPNEIKPVLNIWSGEMVTWDPFEQTGFRKTKEVN